MNQEKTIRQRLKDGETVFGMFYKLNSPAAVEMIEIGRAHV